MRAVDVIPKKRVEGATAASPHRRPSRLLYEVTRADRRQASPPRYELNGETRKPCFGLLGTPPEHPWFWRLKADEPAPPPIQQPKKEEPNPRRRRKVK
jgi:hypothetical protein